MKASGMKIMNKRRISRGRVGRGFALLLACVIGFSTPAAAQSEKPLPFKGIYENAENRVIIRLNLYEPTLTAPNLDFLGKMNGYMHGSGIYGIWLLTDFDIKGKTATLRFSNDSGADSQTIEFTQLNDSTFRYKAVGGNDVKKASGRKLVKIVSEMEFRKR